MHAQTNTDTECKQTVYTNSVYKQGHSEYSEWFSMNAQIQKVSNTFRVGVECFDRSILSFSGK